MGQSTVFKSPLCNHIFHVGQLTTSPSVACDCGYTFDSALVLRYLDESDKIETAKTWLANAQVVLQGLKNQLINAAQGGRSVVASNSDAASQEQQAVSRFTVPAAAPVAGVSAGSKASTPIGVTTAAPVPPRKSTPPAPVRPKRAPLSPRAILLIVAGTLTLIGVSAGLATTWNVLPDWAKAAVVLLLVAASGFGAIKSRNFIRALANFLAILSSSLLLLGLYAEALLNPKLNADGATDAARSLYVPICLLVVGAASTWAGRKFKVNGWLFLPPIAVAVATALIAMAFLPKFVQDATQSLGWAASTSWQLLAVSVGGLVTAYAGRWSKVAIPRIEKPTPEQEFLVLEVTREATAVRQIVRLAYLAALAQITILLGTMGVLAIQDKRPDYVGLLALGAFWIFGAWFLERRGSSFTSSGKVSQSVIIGAWTLGFGSLAVTAGSWLTVFDSAQQANYVSAMAAAVLGAAFALAQNVFKRIDGFPIAVMVSRASAWVTWASWLLSTQNFSLGNDAQIGVLVVFLILISATWFVIRRIEQAAQIQIHSIAPASAAAVLWAFATQVESQRTPFESVLNSAMHLIFASVLLALVGYLTFKLNKATDARFDWLGAGIISAANVLVVFGVISYHHKPDTNVGIYWTLFSAAYILAAARLASTGVTSVRTDETVKRMALTASVSLLALPYLQLFVAGTSGGASGIGATVSLVTVINLAIVLAYATWQRSNAFAYAAVPLGTLLAITTDSWSASHTVPGSNILFVAIPLVISAAVIAGVMVIGKLRLALNEAAFRVSTLVLFGLPLIWHLPVQFAQHFTDGGQLNATVNTATLVIFGGLASFGFRSARISALPAGTGIATGMGYIALAFAVVSSVMGDHTPQNNYRFATTLIAITAILVVRGRWSLSALDRNLAFWFGAASIWFGLIAVAISFASREANLGSLVLNQLGFITVVGVVGWNWVLGRLVPRGAAVAAEPQIKSRLSNLELASYLALAAAVVHLSFAFLPPLGPTMSGLVMLPSLEAFQWQSLVAAVLVTGTFAWLRIASARRQSPNPVYFRLVLVSWLAGLLAVTRVYTQQNWWLLALELGILALAMYLDGFFSHLKAAILIGFGACVLSGWVLASQAFYELHFPLSQLFNFAAIFSFVIATWLLNRNPKGFDLNNWSVVLPVVSGMSILIGLSYRFIFFASQAGKQAGWLLNAEWVIGLGLAVAYLFVSKNRVLADLPRAQRSALASSAMSWVLGWPVVMTNLEGPVAFWGRVELYSLISVAALFVFATRFTSRRALWFAYVVALPLAQATDRFARQAWGWNCDGPELFAATMTTVALAGSVLYRRYFGAAKTSDYTWGVPVLFAALPSTLATIVISPMALSEQTASQVWRFVLVNILAALVLVAGIRIGKRGLVWPTTVTLLIGLVPNLYYRIDDVFPDVKVQNEMKALLFATTIYVLIFLLRKTQKLEIPSAVAVGIPAVISISVLFVDTLGALQRNHLEANDWIRFMVLIVVGTSFLTLGAIRKIAGLFYPGIVSVLIAAIPYAWQKTNYGSWVVLLLLAGLIVWVAIRLERFTGWLKELK